MKSDSEIFTEWLQGEGYTPKAKKTRTKATPLYLNDELAKPQCIVRGTSVGGKQASDWRGKIGHRLHDKSITSDCVVTTAQGDTYTIARRTRSIPTVRVSGKDYAADYATLQRIAGTIGNIEQTSD